MKHTKNNKNKYGFTLVETLVAISIILIGLTAAFSVAQLGVSSSSFAKSRTSAYFLAQEAIEAIKSKRDHNIIVGNDWLEGLVNCTGSAGCDFDLKATLDDPSNNPNADEVFLSCVDPLANSCVLQNVPDISGDSQYYGHNGASNSGFTRHIYINEFDPNVEASVRVFVTWKGGTFETISYIFNWF
jgi:prepilin-type N-terminal cleavage/methylation domain-containing protein